MERRLRDELAELLERHGKANYLAKLVIREDTSTNWDKKYNQTVVTIAEVSKPTNNSIVIKESTVLKQGDLKEDMENG